MPVSANRLGAQRAYLLTVGIADLVWEAAHLPLYTLWQTGTPGGKVFLFTYFPQPLGHGTECELRIWQGTAMARNKVQFQKGLSEAAFETA
jgi:hypothetical protein